MASRHIDPYTVLGVSPTATQAEITHAYRRRLRALHPDTRASAAESTSGADDRLQEVVAAYALLRDPARRAQYDRDAKAGRIRDASRMVGPSETVSPGAVRIPVRHVRSEPRAGGRIRPPLWVRPERRTY
jgi:curved DNA-binding protein CbpA